MTTITLSSQKEKSVRKTKRIDCQKLKPEDRFKIIRWVRNVTGWGEVWSKIFVESLMYNPEPSTLVLRGCEKDFSS